MKEISVYVVRTGPYENLAGAFVSKGAAIEHIAGRIRENSGAHPEVKLEGEYRISVPDGWGLDGAPRFVYALLQHIHEASAGTILGFYTTCDKTGKAMKRQSRRFFKEGWYIIPEFKITTIDL